MPHRLSLLRRVGQLRRTYTGEYDATLWRTVATGLSALTTADRAAIYDTLECGFETRLLGENSGPPLTDRIRRAVLPDTTDTAQQQLEAGLFFALGQIAPYIPPESVTAGRSVRSPIVRPGVAEGEAVLHLPAVTAAPIIATLLPHVAGGNVRGLAGLRTQLHRRHVRLYLIDGAPSMSVPLANTSFRQWSALLAFARELTGHEWPTSFDTPLAEQERAAIAAGRTPGLASLGSALFRRLRVLGTTAWLTVNLDGPASMRVDWAGGRTAVQVAAALVHPLAGLPGERFTATCGPAGSITVTEWGTSSTPKATVVLRQAPLAASPPFRQVDATDAWAAFNHVMTLPHPVSPRLAAVER
jgi:hypothetical protein